MAATFEVPDELYRRLVDVAAERGVSADELIVDVLSQQLQVEGGGATADEDPLEALIGSFDSGEPSWATTDTSTLRKQADARRRAS
ncbi:MAG: hypothetical protein ACK5RL_00530 [Acidimicrobiales bacterium]